MYSYFFVQKARDKLYNLYGIYMEHESTEPYLLSGNSLSLSVMFCLFAVVLFCSWCYLIVSRLLMSAVKRCCVCLNDTPKL